MQLHYLFKEKTEEKKKTLLSTATAQTAMQFPSHSLFQSNSAFHFQTSLFSGIVVQNVYQCPKFRFISPSSLLIVGTTCLASSLLGTIFTVKKPSEELCWIQVKFHPVQHSVSCHGRPDVLREPHKQRKVAVALPLYDALQSLGSGYRDSIQSQPFPNIIFRTNAHVGEGRPQWLTPPMSHAQSSMVKWSRQV